MGVSPKGPHVKALVTRVATLGPESQVVGTSSSVVLLDENMCVNILQ